MTQPQPQLQQTGPSQDIGAEAPSTTASQPSFRQFPTRNHLPETTRLQLIERLNYALADTTILLTQSKFAHWNVKGMAFWGLHELFDELADVFARHADMIAERATALGGQAMGTAGLAVANCRLPGMPTDAVTGDEYVNLMAERLAIHDANLYDDITTANRYDDPDTADLLNELSREVTQYLWFLEAHLQTQPLPSGQPAGSPPMDRSGGVHRPQPPGPPEAGG